MAKCPICGKGTAKLQAFCSPRCRQIDLGKWLNEDYRISAANGDGEDEEARSTSPTPQPPHTKESR